MRRMHVWRMGALGLVAVLLVLGLGVYFRAQIAGAGVIPEG